MVRYGIWAGALWRNRSITVDQPQLPISLSIPDMRLPARVPMIAADTLAPNMHQGISNHNADSIVILVSQELYYAKGIML